MNEYYTVIYNNEPTTFGQGTDGRYLINNGRYAEEALFYTEYEARAFMNNEEFDEYRHMMTIEQCEAYFNEEENKWDVYLK